MKDEGENKAKQTSPKVGIVRYSSASFFRQIPGCAQVKNPENGSRNAKWEKHNIEFGIGFNQYKGKNNCRHRP